MTNINQPVTTSGANDAPIFANIPSAVQQSKVDDAFSTGYDAGHAAATASVSPVMVDSTPNEKIANPDTRRLITKIATLVGAILGTIIIVDKATPDFDLSAWTDPIAAGFLYITSFYGIYVTLPNIPGKK